MNKLPEHILLNALSLGVNIEFEKKISFEENCILIINSLSSRNFKILFPHYWTHHDVANFSANYEGYINEADLEWYLLKLKSIFSGRKNSEIHWIERVNFFHSIACTRFLNEHKTDTEKVIRVMKEVSGFDLKNSKFKSLTDISTYNFLALKSDIEIENPIVFKVLKSFKDETLLINYAKYQVFYYGGTIECITKMMTYSKKTNSNIVVPYTTMSLLCLKNINNFPRLNNPEAKDLLNDLLKIQSKKMRKIICKISNE